jgi:LAGLIDADG DNA endonuclease family
MFLSSPGRTNRSFSNSAGLQAKKINEGPSEGLVKTTPKETGNQFNETQQSKMQLTNEQMQVGVGVMLGDGSITKSSNGSTLSLAQGTVHTSYFLFVFGLLFDLCKKFPNMYSTWDVRYHHYNYQWKFYTAALSCLNKLYSLFYDEQGKRRIRPDLIVYLTPIALAHWIICDGEKLVRGGLFLNTFSFSMEEVDLLISIIKTNFSLDCHRIIKRSKGKVYWRIYISGKRENLNKLIDLVLPHMHSSMYYKLGL